MKQPKLSIILPVYNTEKYLSKCLDSILNSTFQDFELIIINDGSPDDSEKIIKEYINKFIDDNGKIVYILKENSGLSDTRNLGIKKAKAPYVMFIDSDDYIEPNMLELMTKKLDEFDFDLVVCDVNLVYEDNIKKKVRVSSGYTCDLYDKPKINETMISYYPVVWNKIYKKEILNDVKFPVGAWYEDMEFNLKLYPSITSMGVVKKPLYNYLQRKQSLTYTYNDKLYDIINNMESVLDFYHEKGLYDEYKEQIEYLYARYAFATFPKRLAKCGSIIKYKEGIKYALDKVHENFPNYKQNKHLKTMGAKGWYIKHFNRFSALLNYIVQNLKKYN